MHPELVSGLSYNEGSIPPLDYSHPHAGFEAESYIATYMYT